MLYKLSKESKIYGLLSLLLVSSIAIIPTSVNAQEQACVITNSGKKVCGKLVRDSNEDQLNTLSQPIVTVNLPTSAIINVQLLKCSRKSSIVSCKFSATITDMNVKGMNLIRFYSADGTKVSQATDSEGEDYIAERVIIGKSESKVYLISSMVQNQPISITLLFKIPPGANTIKTLSFLTGDVFRESAARFSNVDISR